MDRIKSMGHLDLIADGIPTLCTYIYIHICILSHMDI
jgi:hypothetical protein